MNRTFSSNSSLMHWRYSFLFMLFLLCVPTVCLPESLDEFAVAFQSKDVGIRKATLEKFVKEYFPKDPEQGRLWSKKESRKIDRILVGLLGDPEPQIRLRAIRLSVRSTSAVPIDEVAKLLRDRNDEVRAAAAGIYIMVDASVDDLRQLEKLLKDESDPVKRAATYSLGPHCKRTSPAIIQEAYQKEKDKNLKKSLADTLECALQQQGKK